MRMNNKGTRQPNDSMLIFPGFAAPDFFHGVFNRLGGVSLAPWDSRNVSFRLGDKPEHVRTNRLGIKKRLGFDQLVSAKQIHDSRVYIVKEKPESDVEVDGFDALITDVAGVGLMIQQADCQAVMLFDPQNRAVGIAHAGWRGSVADIIFKTVSAMHHAYNTGAADITAAISPSLGPCCAEFINYRRELPKSFHAYQARPNYFDFWAISHDQLCAVGVKSENIHSANICTSCDTDYFSYRREKKTGRCASVIGLIKRPQKPGTA
jgi:purine-nucleoside/S-methyl-5'-thioadenosine phosphorylase / adenosine deaminase